MLVIKGKGFQIEGGKGFQQYLQFCKKLMDQKESGTAFFIPSGYNLKLFGEDITIEEIEPYNDFKIENKEDNTFAKIFEDAESGKPNKDEPEIKENGLFNKKQDIISHSRNFDKNPKNSKRVYFLPKENLYTINCKDSVNDIEKNLNKKIDINNFINLCLENIDINIVENKPLYYLAFREGQEEWKPVILRYLNKDKLGTRGSLLIPAKDSMYFATLDTLNKKIKMLITEYKKELNNIQLAIKIAFKFK